MPPVNGRSYWRSLDELAGTEEFRDFVGREFPAYADEMLEPASRRSFLKIMGASLALAGMTACRWPKEEILPFADRPEGLVPGEPLRFATALETAGVAAAVLVTSYDGRPIKIEGNPEHPASLGGTTAISQAAILEMYDPDRSRQPVERDGDADFARTWNEFTAHAARTFGKLRSSRGRGLRILAEAGSSPGLEALRRRFELELPEARWVEWEPLGRDAEAEGTSAVFGTPHRPQHDLSHADVIVSFDEDFVVAHPNSVRYARDFTKGRRAGHGPINRLYSVETAYSPTGTMADHRIALAPSQVAAAVGALAARLVFEHGIALPAALGSLRGPLEQFRGHSTYERVARIAADLAEHRGKSVVLAGASQPSTVHALVAAINEMLGNTGHGVTYTAQAPGASGVRAVVELANEMRAGRVGTLLMLGGNPVYDAPADCDFATALAAVPESIHLGLHRNETGRAATWHVPRAHALESWGDARDWHGRVTIMQPLIEPLFGGQTPAEVVSLLLGDARTAYEIAREAHAERGGDDAGWRRALHDGIVEGSVGDATAPAASSGSWVAQVSGLAVAPDGIEAVFTPSTMVWDGRFANNGWLQETPDPLTKLTWDNAALIGPSTAERLGVGQGDMLRVRAGDRQVDVAAYVMPGQAPDSVALPLGFGRTAAGSVGDGVGFDVYPLRTSASLAWTAVQLETTGESYKLATTQNHYLIDPRGQDETEDRAEDLVREIDVADMSDHGHDDDGHHGDDAGGHDGPHVVNLWKQWDYTGHKWGMAIDLNACTGCSACVVACQAENNIPVVGKDEVSRGRFMHWIRVDRYFKGEPDDPTVAHQPLTCQHCENAPCEQVCPVAATVHDSEGVNVMVYNRCVGTRYCLNNCPYKVRRFNYFNNHKNETPLQQMAYNPEVTVRSRGVMEKCSFCIQRINRVKIEAKNAARPIRDGEITTACAQACPTRAISFGDLNDESSRVRKDHDDPRAYSILEFLHVKPRARYLTRMRNRGASAHGEGKA